MSDEINSLDDLRPGQLYRPREIAHLLPGNSVKKVRAMCQDGELEHTVITGRAGTPNYWIPGDAVRAWRRRNTVKKAA